MALNFFYPAISGIDAQSKAMETIGMNISNMRTTGYKSEETLFKTMLGNSPAVKGNSVGIHGKRTDIHGVKTYNRVNVNNQGEIHSTGNLYDVAINRNDAFFVVKDNNNSTYYTRAGDFGTKTENGKTYLVSGTGEKVQGFTAGNGGFAGSLSDIVLNFQEKIPSIPSTKVKINANVPASGVDTSSYNINIVGPNNDGRNMNMVFNKVEGKIDTWKLDFTIEDGTVSHSSVEVVFGQNGEILTPKEFDIAVNWDDGSQNNVNIDISKFTQYAGNSAILNIEQDGRRSGSYTRSYIDNDGILKAQYDNGNTLDISKIALVGFTSPENLTPISNTLFFAGTEAGENRFVLGPNDTDLRILNAQSLEASNVNVEKEFSNMIITQRAYSLNSNTFSVIDEMISTIIDVKT